MRTSLVTPYIFSALVVIVAANAGLTTSLGAHPFWAVQIAWIGVPIGLALAILTKFLGTTWRLRVTLFAFCTIGAAAAAYFGKSSFAAFFAENALAGKAWYFGWIAVAAFTTALIAAVFSPTPHHQPE